MPQGGIQIIMKVSELIEYSKPVLAGAVKLSQRKQLVDDNGNNWHDWVQAQPVGKKLSDPRRYSNQQLAEFLASLSSQKPDPRAPDKPLVKPQKLLKRYLPWLALKMQHDQVVSGGGDAAASGADQQQLKADPVWQLMQRTRSHPRFHQMYSFDSYDKGWVCTGRPSSEEAAAAPSSGSWKLLGVDCEMCKTADNDKELLQVAVVDEDGTLLMQELVRPSSPVLDYRTEITGIQEADLEGVALTRKAAAKRVSKLLTPQTVLVGHGLHNDLQALQLDHPWVIDTCTIFTFKGLSTFTPSLALLSEQLLGEPLRGRDPSAPLSTSQAQLQHDSREDASVALALVKQELQRTGPTPVLEPPQLKVDKEDLTKLCVHRLPRPADKEGNGGSSSPGDITAAVKATLATACKQTGAGAAAEAVSAAAVEQPNDSSKQLLYLVFANAAVANIVFAALPGAVFTDSVGRHSKAQVMLGSTHKVVVRKMACHNGLAFGKDMAADRGAQQGGRKQKRKAPGTKKSSKKPRSHKKHKA